MQLLGEEVDTQVSVLASGRGGGHADDLARATLEDEEITEADVVAWDGYGIGRVGGGGRLSGRSFHYCRSADAAATDTAATIFVVVTHLV